MKFTVDPWDPSYGSSTESDMQQSEMTVVVDVEVAERDWAPRRPAPNTTAPEAVIFVDGVRRIEARAWIDLGDGDAIAGVFASYAAGAVRCDGTAELVEAAIGRGLYSPGALADVETRHGRFTARTTKDASPEATNTAANRDMAECEATISERAARSPNDLVVVDGPLRTRGNLPDAVGLIKTHHMRYLPGDLDRVIARLQPGERTPVFRIDAAPFSRTSWYVRLPGPPGGPWAGIVRCETVGALATETVTALADRVTLTLPRFASTPHKDARAPQNLYPIGGLERLLRHRLGDANVLYRALRRASAGLAR